MNNNNTEHDKIPPRGTEEFIKTRNTIIMNLWHEVTVNNPGVSVEQRLIRLTAAQLDVSAEDDPYALPRSKDGWRYILRRLGILLPLKEDNRDEEKD